MSTRSEECSNIISVLACVLQQLCLRNDRVCVSVVCSDMFSIRSHELLPGFFLL
jgi:hypothetical protein